MKEYIQNESMIINFEFKRNDRKWSWSISSCYPVIFKEELRKTATNFSPDSCTATKDLNSRLHLKMLYHDGNLSHLSEWQKPTVVHAHQESCLLAA
jgi:hypothetical protein